MTAPQTFSVDGVYAPLFDDDPIILSEQASAPSAQPNKAIIYAIDNGSGKTRLMVQFPTGSAVQLAIEP
jgi:hypothetical protein